MSPDIDPEDEQDIIDQFEVAVDHAFHDAIRHGANPDEVKEILDHYADECGEGILSRTEARQWLTEVGDEVGKEYFEEAEHQEGYSYWTRMIEDMESLRKDFALYIMTVEECDVCGDDDGYFDDDDKLRCANCDEVQPV